jgi:FHS family L-fucose permease-like MFS transporter
MLIRRAGYKFAMITGLMLFAIGSLMFIPAANTQLYVVFLGALFTIACGLTILETAANPYMTLLGSPEKAAQRLNLAQSFNGLATMVAPLIGARLILVHGATDAQLAAMPEAARAAALAAEASSVKGPYMLLGLVILAMAIVFYFLKLPQVGSEASAQGGEAPAKSTLGEAFRVPSIRRGAIAQFFYVGAQVCVFSFFILYATKAAGVSSVTAADYLGLGYGLAFMGGRFIGTALMRSIAPARLLWMYALAATVLAAVAMFSHGFVSIAAVIGIAFFMSIMFPTIFSLGLNNAGHHADMGSGLIIMSIVGGALLPPLFGFISDRTENVQFGYAVPLVCYVVVAWFARASLRQDSRDARAATVSMGVTERV